ncbi:MAG TPA: hypothetical protein VFL95_12110 [Gemmatimonadales bacterium]|nr:hypothetical protein [Gemmatimonadales bacterium]
MGWKITTSAAAMLLLLAAPVMAQATGRWAMVITGGVPPHLRGELRIAAEGGRLTGTLQLETSDSAPVALTGLEESSDGTIAFRTSDAPEARWVGQLSGNSIVGHIEGPDDHRQWTADRLPPGAEYYAALPRFTLREIVISADPADSLPGAWLAAARAGGWTPARALAEYRTAAAAAGFRAESLDGGTLAPLLGGRRNGRLIPAVRSTLQQIRDAIPRADVRRAFDQLFRPRGEWLVDIHDVALYRARITHPSLQWSDAVPALRQLGQLPRDASDPGAVPMAIYRLVTEREADTARARIIDTGLTQADPASAAALENLLRGYDEAAGWYVAAMNFFLIAPWIPDSAGGHSLAHEVGRFWGTPTPPPPSVTAHFYGYPQGAPRFGAPPELLQRLVVPENWAARRWLERHGWPGMVPVLHLLNPPHPGDLSLEDGARSYRIATVAGQSAASINGFLEPEPSIALDPGYIPILALGTLVHEWQHLLFEDARLADSAADPVRQLDGAVAIVPADPVIAEGIAEWSSAQIMAPVVARWPLLGVGEPAKRARMARVDSTDSHLNGYLLVSALAQVVPQPAQLRALLVRASSVPSRVMGDSAVARAWARWRDAPGRPPVSGGRVLIPETRFTVDTGWPDLAGVRIVVPTGF